jgi:carbon-monoxide dehydrogenase medium subunit
MIPSSFEYHRPASLGDAVGLLARLGSDAKVLAGGQSLIPLMKLRLATPGHVVDINRIPGLTSITERSGPHGRRPRSRVHSRRPRGIRSAA